MGPCLMVVQSILVRRAVPSSSAITNPIDPLSGTAPLSVAVCTLFVDLSSSYIVIGTGKNSSCA